MASNKSLNGPTGPTTVTLLTELDMVQNWKRQQTLGSGTFATITLWVNTETNERIAIKQFKINQIAFLPRQMYIVDCLFFLAIIISNYVQLS